jgi:hypothetical protein
VLERTVHKALSRIVTETKHLLGFWFLLYGFPGQRHFACAPSYQRGSLRN